MAIEESKPAVEDSTLNSIKAAPFDDCGDASMNGSETDSQETKKVKKVPLFLNFFLQNFKFN